MAKHSTADRDGGRVTAYISEQCSTTVISHCENKIVMKMAVIGYRRNVTGANYHTAVALPTNRVITVF